MKVLVGVVPNASSDDALALAAVLCAALDGEAVLCHVHPAAYDYASPGHVDAEWERYLLEESRTFLKSAAAKAAEFGLTDVSTVVGAHRSSGVGLAEVAITTDADLIVVGSSPGAANGRFLIGSTADQLLHGSTVPVALAPAYYRGVRPERLGRLVAAFQNSNESRAAALTAAQLAVQADVPLTLLTVLVRHRIYGSALRSGEDLVLQQLREDVAAEQERARADLGTQVSADCVITTGDDAVSALGRFDWEGDELLVLASASGGALRRVFLGDMTYKLVRATSVPAVVLPRHT